MPATGTMAGSARPRWTDHPERRYQFASGKGEKPKGEPYKGSELEDEFMREFYLRYDPTSRHANHFVYHRQWWMNMAYFLGMHWLQFSSVTGRLEERQTPPWRQLYTANRIFTAVLRTQSKLLVDGGIARMLPKTADRKDALAAKHAEIMCEHLQDVLQYDEMRAEIGLWKLICGTGFAKFWWNPRGGEPVTVQTQGGTKTVMTGELEADACSPFSVRIPNFVNKMKFMPWLVHVTTRPLEYIWANWPEKARFVTPDANHGWENWIEERMHALVGPSGATAPGDDDTYPGMVKVYSLYAKPTEEYPKGIAGVVAGGVPMQIDQEGGKLVNEYNGLGCPIPFQDYRFVRAPGRFWGASLVEQMIHPQREYNRARSQIIENKDLMSRPKWLLPKGHGIPKNGITGSPGEIIEYNASAGPKPEQVDVKPLPNYVIDHLDRCVQELQDVSAQQEVTQAKAPASIRSGVAIQLLQAGDNAVLAGVKQGLMFSDRGAYRIMLKIASVKYTEPRLITVFGRDSIIENFSLKGEDLRGHTDIRVFAESGLLDTKAARQQQVLDYVQLGILNPQDPDEKLAILKMLEVGDVRSFVRDRLLDERMAEWENEGMASTEKFVIVEPKDFEDHQVHIQRHNALRKSVEYRLLPAQQQQAIDMHVSGHQTMLAAQMQAQMQMMDASKGTPGEKGKPSAPGGGASSKAAPGEERTDQKTSTSDKQEGSKAA